MGSHPNINTDKFPKQTDMLGKQVDVCFHYNSDEFITGIVVRDDAEAPYEMLFQLPDGRIVRSTECQYRPKL